MSTIYLNQAQIDKINVYWMGYSTDGKLLIPAVPYAQFSVSTTEDNNSRIEKNGELFWLYDSAKLETAFEHFKSNNYEKYTGRKILDPEEWDKKALESLKTIQNNIREIIQTTK